MKGITRRSFSLFVCVMVLLSVASYGGLAADWESSDLKAHETEDISSQLDNNDWRGLEWADNGNVLFAATRSSPFIYQLEAEEPYSISNLTFVTRKSHPEFNGPNGIEVSPDGTKLFLTDAINDEIERYTLSDPYNLSSATSSPDQTLNLGGNAGGFAFNDDGTELTVGFSQTQDSGQSGHLERWSLGGAYDLSGASQVDTIDTTHHAQDVEFGDNGTKMYVGEDALSSNSVAQYDLPDPYNSSSLENASSHGLPGISDGTGLDWGNEEGEFLYVSGQDGTLHQLTTGDHTVSGIVRYGNGTVVEGASISVNASTVSDQTNATGFYEVPLSNGTYEITSIKDPVDGPSYKGSVTVEVNGSDVTDANITIVRDVDLEFEVPSHMWQNDTADYTVWDVQADGSKIDVTENATVTSSDPTNLTVNSAAEQLESVNDTSFNGEIAVTASFENGEVTKNVTIGNKSAENLGLMQNSADMVAAVWGDVPHPETGDRTGGSQLTARIIAVALLVGVPLSRELNGLAGVAGFGITMTAGWFMGWVGTGMILITGIVCLFIGLNTAQMRARREGPI